MAGPMSKFKDQIKNEVEKRIAGRKPGETTLGRPLPRDPKAKEKTPASTTTTARSDVSRGAASANAVNARRRTATEITLWPERFVTGSTVYFEGKQIPITIHVTGVDQVEIEYTDRLTVRVPISAAYRGRDEAIKNALVSFYVDHLVSGIGPLVQRYSAILGILAPEVVIDHLEKALGRFGEHGEIVFNASLAFAPKFVLEYIVVHELTYRRVRSKEREFWRTIESVMPDFRLRAEWLRQYGEILRSGIPAATSTNVSADPVTRDVTPRI